MAHFHHGAERGLSVPCRAGPVFGCVSTMPSSGPGLLFHLFSGLTKSWFYRGQQTGLSRAEFAKLERESLAGGLQLQQDDINKAATVFAITQTVCDLYLFNFCLVSEQI